MKFFDLFPVPKYLKVPFVGFDISDRSIKYIQLEKIPSKGYIIKNFGETEIPQGIIVGGEIKKENEFISFLNSNFKNFEVRNLAISLPEEKVFLEIIEFPKMDLNSLRHNLRMQLENYFPIKQDEAIFDYEVLDFVKEDKMQILVAVFPRVLIDAYINAFSKSGFNPIIFELEANAIKECLIKKDDFPKMIIDFGKTRTSFIIVVKNNVLFTSTINIRGEDLNKIIQRSLSVSEDEAEKIKKEKGKIFSPIKSFLNSTEENEIQSILMPVFSAFHQEIEKYLSYFGTHYGNFLKDDKNSIQEIILCGGDSVFPGLADYLGSVLKMPVKLGNAWINVCSFDDYIPEITFNESLKFVTAVGLALKIKDII